MKQLSVFQVALSYLLLLISYIWFDWNPFMFFFTYLLEIVVLLVIYSALRIKDEAENPKKYRKSQPLLNVLIGAIPLIVFQFFFIVIAAGLISAESNKELQLHNEPLWGFVALLVGYLITFLLLKADDKVVIYRDNFLFKCLTLTATTIVALILITTIGIWSKWLVLSATLVTRFLIEWRYYRITSSVPL